MSIATQAGDRMRRRVVRVVASALGVALLAGVLTVAAPAKAIQDVKLIRKATPADHQAQAKSLKGQGYRPISMSVYGNAINRLYEATWVKREGPAFVVFQEQTPGALVALMEGYRLQGYRISILTATPTLAGSMFAGVFEKSTFPVVVDTALKVENFAGRVAWAHDNNYSLRWVSPHGSLLAAVWWPNYEQIPWNAFLLYPDQLEPITNVLKGSGLRLDQLAQLSNGWFVTSWRDESVGAWSARSALVEEAFGSFLGAPNGSYPMRVQAIGAGSAVRYSAIFALDDRVLDRKFSVTGNDSPPLSGFDEYMTDLMRLHNVRAGALAIVKSGKLVFSHGYTWSEPGTSLTQPTSQFRVASVSKTLAGVVATQLNEHQLLLWDEKMQDILHVRRPGGQLSPVDPRWSGITVDELVGHRGGWDNTAKVRNVYDPMSDVDAASAYGGVLPVNRDQLASYAATKPLMFDPGAEYHYSNFGFLMLGKIIEARAGLGEYPDVVQSMIFERLGVKRAGIGSSTASSAPGEVSYHPWIPGVSQSVVHSDRRWVPNQYGGFSMENGVTPGSWRMAAPDYARVLAAFDGPDDPLFDVDGAVNTMWTDVSPATPGAMRGWYRIDLKNASGQVVPAVQHNGGLPGTSTLVMRRSDGLSFVLFLNGDFPGKLSGQAGGLHAEIQGVELNAIANQVTSWPTEDLFHDMGIDDPVATTAVAPGSGV